MTADLIALARRLPTPIVLIGPEARILAINTAGEAILGQGAEGRHFITALRHPTLVEAIEHALKSGDVTVRDRVTLTRDGQPMTFELSAGQIPIGAEAGVVLCLEDQTGATQAEEIRRDFVANVSHELKTPLTALTGFIETLRTTARDDPDAQERFLKIMETEAARMNRLITDLLSLSRVEADERVRPRGHVDLIAVLRSVRAALEPLAAATRAVLSLRTTEEAVTVSGDEDQLRQVLTNIVENALKYGRDGTTVDMSLEIVAAHPLLRQDAVCVTVRDSGEGIDPVHIPRLTDRFYRVDTHRSRAQGGTGLGLAIVKHIVNRHRGRLKIDSVPGQGTTVVVVLPLARGAAA
jgi:two-component system phosphate regulon sensor histidine kinase PhoR